MSRGSWRWDTTLWISAIWIPGHLAGWLVEKVWILVAASGLAYLALVNARYREASTPRGMPAENAKYAKLVMVTGYFASMVAVLGFLLATFRDETLTMGDWTDLPVPLLQTVLLFTLVMLSPRLNRPALLRATRWSIVTMAIVHSLYRFGGSIAFENTALDALYGTTKTARYNSVIRVSVPFENPNHLAFFLVIALVLLLSVALYEADKLNLMVAAATLALVVSTGSRSGLVASVVVLAWFGLAFVLQRWRHRDPASLAVRGTITVAIVALALSAAPELTQRFAVFQADSAPALIAQILDERNVESRIEQVGRASAVDTSELLFGVGAASSRQLSVVDNQYARWISRLGLLGAAGFVLMLAAAATYAVRSGRRSRRMGSGALLAALAVFLLTGSFLTNSRLFVLAAMSLWIARDWEHRDADSSARDRCRPHHAERRTSHRPVSLAGSQGVG